MKRYLTFIILLALLAGCKKSFLDAKPDQTLLVPTTLTDFQALLDYNTVMNVSPALTTIASDDIYTTTAGFNATTLATARNAYFWADDIFGATTTTDWDIPYQQVFYSNVVLDGSGSLSGSANIRGQAYFNRAFAYYQLLQEFAQPYAPATAASLPGLPLHLTADVNLRPGRGTLPGTYAQVISDLQHAAALLPATQTSLSRPNRTAALALLARTSLVLQNYAQAKLYADSVIAGSGKLLDYNTLSAAAAKPFPAILSGGNPEAIYYSSLVSYTFLKSTTACLVDSNLFASYAATDLRKTVLYTNKGKGVVLFKGSYNGTGVLTNFFFGGIALDELYLVRAECNARLGNTGPAMSDLNALLVKRYQNGTFVQRTATGGTDALQQVLTERRKELVFRGTRWTDLRRLNQESALAVTLTRIINGLTYTLAPNANKYTFPIPPDEIVGGGIVQNPR